MVIEIWNAQPERLAESHSIWTFKRQLDMFTGLICRVFEEEEAGE